MRKTYIILGILVVVALALYLVLSHIAKVNDQQTVADINTFLNDKGYIIPESERGDFDLTISKSGTDMYEVILKFDGLHDDSVSGMEKTLILRPVVGPEKFIIEKDTTKYQCSRGETAEGLCI